MTSTGTSATVASLENRLGELTQLSTAQLRSEWQRIFGSVPPQRLGRDLLLRAVAYALQERIHGGLSQATRRRLRTLSDQSDGKGRGQMIAAPQLRPGIRLVREWNGHTHEVQVLESGFDYRGQRYRSLTEIAKHITGTHWSGPRFFGLTQAAGKQAKAASKPSAIVERDTVVHAPV